MVTLEHVFSAKDMNALIVKIIREQVFIFQLKPFFFVCLYEENFFISFRHHKYRRNIVNH
jgi:hypothetical protein